MELLIILHSIHCYNSIIHFIRFSWIYRYLTLDTLFNSSGCRPLCEEPGFQPQQATFLSLLFCLTSSTPSLPHDDLGGHFCVEIKTMDTFLLHTLRSNTEHTQLSCLLPLQAQGNNCFPPSLNITPLFHSSISLLSFCRALQVPDFYDFLL